VPRSLDDPVVDDRDLDGGVAMRVGVSVCRPAVSGPTGMAHPGVPTQRYRVGGVQRVFQVGQPPGTAAHRQSAATVDQGDTGGVVAPVLHAAQCSDHHIAGATVPDITDDSAHIAHRTASQFEKQQIRRNLQKLHEDDCYGNKHRRIARTISVACHFHIRNTIVLSKLVSVGWRY
jgi:hypothetical protein